MNGFGGMFARIMKDGVVSLKTKELIAVSIGVAIQCEPCIRLHVQKCLDAGCTKEEILEATSVAVMMSGGPAYTHMPMVIETIEALQA
jgi:AhpD family alkylhydroperoxidase